MGLTDPAHKAHTDLKFPTVAGWPMTTTSTRDAANMHDGPRTWQLWPSRTRACLRACGEISRGTLMTHALGTRPRSHGAAPYVPPGTPLGHRSTTS
jgi:hypothetical protein